MNRTRLLTLIETALLTAMAYVLGELQFSFHPQGGGISLVMLPIAILAFRRGVLAGLVSGLLVGLLKLPGGYILVPTQAILDYPLPFMLLGLAGIFVANKNKSPLFLYIIGIVVAGLLRGLSHVLSGAIFFAEYAWEGWGAWTYSIVYNCTYIIPEIILTVIVVSIFYFKANHILHPKKEY